MRSMRLTRYITDQMSHGTEDGFTSWSLPRLLPLLFPLLLFVVSSFAQVTHQGTLSSHNSQSSHAYPALNAGFDRNKLVNSNSFLMDPNRFNMDQSYSMSYWATSNGSSSSQGLYLNHMTYALSSHLHMFVDMGYHTPFHSQFQAQDPRSSAFQEQNSSLVIPRFGLEYQPSENVFMSLQFINGNDAMRAYGADVYHPWMGTISSRNRWNRPNNFNRTSR